MIHVLVVFGGGIYKFPYGREYDDHDRQFRADDVPDMYSLARDIYLFAKLHEMGQLVYEHIHLHDRMSRLDGLLDDALLQIFRLPLQVLP